MEHEERIAHLERTVDDLSAVVHRQAGEIAVLERRVRMLMERVAEGDEAGGSVVLGDERPPHY
ncbi:SlyX family protein [Jannaschia sp. Os4]|uniref:SlyX family protein n=1 Tax=Jannaschia sp. Os4 TaxID=2807617 RepID=UPI00193A1FC7|nr:SlyX family protein [Jannaschia sp. Os4]